MIFACYFANEVNDVMIGFEWLVAVVSAARVSTGFMPYLVEKRDLVRT